MADQYYYVDARNERIGPVSWEVLEQLHRAGVVADATLVCPEGGSDWLPFSEMMLPQPEPSAALPGAVAKKKNKASRRSNRDEKESIGWRTVAVLVGIVALFVGLDFLLTYSDDPRLKMKPPLATPKKASLPEMARAIESMPKSYHRIPNSNGKEQGIMLLFTGENSVQVRRIPDHEDLYQIDITRYAVVYDRSPSKPVTRNALTLLLSVSAEFKDRRWNLFDARGGSVDQVTKPGQTTPDQKVTESISLETAMWHGQRVIDEMNSDIKKGYSAKRRSTDYEALEEFFLQEHQKIGGIRAQGIRFPE